MGADLRDEHPPDVLFDEGSRSAYETGQRYHQHGFGQLGHAEPELLAYATTKGAIQNFTGLARCRREGDPGERGRAGTDLDAADSVDHARGSCHQLRKTGAYEARWTTGRTRDGLCHAGRPAVELYPARRLR